VSVICPQAVRTAMLGDLEDGGVQGADGVLEPEDVAQSAIEALKKEHFLVLPHPEVLDYMRRKTSDYDRWLKGMRRMRARFMTS
ncbi:MAG: short-chain dehydrogenase, partial [Gemmatimonadota bacterium]|nr:short-chain dehydrogenase [Gemmatimonadota bacterium]